MKPRLRYVCTLFLALGLVSAVVTTQSFALEGEEGLNSGNHVIRVHSGYGYYRPYHGVRANFPYHGSWRGWGWGGTVWGSWARALGQLRVQTARANYMNAMAYQQWVRARAYRRLMQSVTADLWRLEREKYKIEKKRERLYSHAKSLNALKLGKASAAALNALFYFENLPGFYELPTLKASRGFVGPFGKEQFVARHPYKMRYLGEGRMEKIEIVVTDFPGGDFIQLLNWLRINSFDLAKVTSQEEPTAWQVLRQVGLEIEAVRAATEEALRAEKSMSQEEFKEYWGERVWDGHGPLRSYRSEYDSAEALGH